MEIAQNIKTQKYNLMSLFAFNLLLKVIQY
jgi:hypothetical protein